MINRIRIGFGSISIKYKIMVMLYLVILPVLLVLVSYLYYTMQRSASDSLSSAYQEITRQINESISFIQTDVEDISTYICINESVLRALNERENCEDINQIWNEDSSMNFFMDIIGSKTYISFVALYANNGYEPYYITTDGSVLTDHIDAISDSQSYRSASAAKGAPVWEYVDTSDKTLFVLNKTPKVVMSRVIIDYMEVKNIGYLLIGIDADYLEGICLENAGGNEGILVEKNHVALLEKGEMEDIVKSYIRSEEFREKMKKTKNGMETYERWLIYYDQLEDNGSCVYYVVPEEVKHGLYRTATNVSAALVIGILLLLLPLSSYMSDYIARPLKNITDSMQKFKKGDFNQQVKCSSSDEIGEVALCYNDMVNDIRELIDTKYLLEIREKEAELSALQAQINPHFLYNVLDSIYWKAMADGSRETAEMVYSLSRIFRLSLNRGQSMTTVEKELELITHYLSIQKMRFEERLEYRTDIDPVIYNAIIPKLILQPFVENAILHGIEQEKEKGKVIISGRLEDQQMIFEILDNGKGMNDEQLNDLLMPPKGDINTSKRPGGYAVYNVYERLRLKYRDKFALTVESSQGEGTRITMKIPEMVWSGGKE